MRITNSNQKILYSTKGNNDCCYTPAYGVIPIIKYLPKDKIIWCPFDTDSSQYVKLLKENGYKVVYGDIQTGQDFYQYEPEKWDIIVSNPPFTNKRKIFERCIAFNKPFALLMSNIWLNDAAPKQLFKDYELELLMFDKRILFENFGIVNKKITFSSSYFCHGVLPKQLIMEEIKCI